jgi:phosphogluconate dehydratase
MDALVEDGEWRRRTPRMIDASAHHAGLGRELFALMRTRAGTAEEGACCLFVTDAEPAA